MRIVSTLAMLWGVSTGLITGLVGCAAKQPSLPTVPHVDLQRFMGDWYVIATIPTWPEQNAYNAVESYALNPDGTITVTFTLNEGGFDGPRKEYHPKGFVGTDGSNAIWGMQFVWPVKAEYLISFLDAEYSQTVIARSSRDYVWLMARTPTVSDADYDRFVRQIGAWGYDVAKLRRVPQRW